MNVSPKNGGPAQDKLHVGVAAVPSAPGPLPLGIMGHQREFRLNGCSKLFDENTDSYHTISLRASPLF